MLHPLKLDTAQSRGHEAWLHERDSFSAGHVEPPSLASCVTLRARDCAPVPHDTVQALHAENEETVQWTGHGPFEHACCAAVTSSHVPPYMWPLRIVRERCCVPPAPQDLLQPDHVPHAVTTQSTGHAWVLQARATITWLHAAPPKAGGLSTPRVRFCEPPPHDAEHTPQVPHAPRLQSTGQGAAPQLSVPFRSGQALPPYASTVLTPRRRVRAPPPHDPVQSPHPPHRETLQSIGHDCALHTLRSTATPHCLPPCKGAMEFLWRLRSPVPHVREQSDQFDHGPSAQSTGHSK